MIKYLKVAASILIILLISFIITIVSMEFAGIARPRRQPLNIEITETESPFSVSDRHDEVRDWIDERVGQE